MISFASACADMESIDVDLARRPGRPAPWIRVNLRAVHEQAAARAGRLIADEQHRVARVRQRAREVMQHAAAGRHAARRDDDRTASCDSCTARDSWIDVTTFSLAVQNAQTSRCARARCAVAGALVRDLGIELVRAARGTSSSTVAAIGLST